MQWRVILAELKQETATFNPAPTVYDDFRIALGRDMYDAYRGTKTEVAGVIDTLEADGRCEVVPTMAAAAVSGGPIRSQDLDRLLDELVAAIQQAGPADGICLCLHGAMAGQHEGDPEGRLLAAIRAVVGSVPLVASLDLHAVLTDRMVQQADILVPFHTYPHTDQYETGQRAARNLIGLLEGKFQPTVARVRLPMLVRGDELLTATGRFGEAIRMCQTIEDSPGGLAAGVIIGNAFTDVAALQSHVLVTTHSDPQRAHREAERIGRFMWQHRELFQAKLTPLDEAMEVAEKSTGLVVFSDAADATSSGASGDSNAILRGLLDRGFSRQTLLPIVDAPAVLAACEAGVGSHLHVALGGTRDPTRFTPVTLPVYVKSLHDGRFTYENGTGANGGRTAVLQSGPLHLLVTQRPVYVVGRRVFESHGLFPVEFDLVVVKSPNGFRTHYESIAQQIVAVDVPGSTSANLRSLPFKNCVRPIFPLDEKVPAPFASRSPE